MTSITSWLRLEPRTRNADMAAGLQARIYDPLWLLARQWQTGEFQGEDAGSPAAARWRGEAAPISRYFAGPLAAGATADGQPFDAAATPLEVMVEAEPPRAQSRSTEFLRFAAVAGQQFLRLLAQLVEQGRSADYRGAFTTKFGLSPLSPDDRESVDAESAAFLDVMAGRVPDGRRLYDRLNAALRPRGPGRGQLPPDLAIDRGDIAEVELAARGWLDWCDTLLTRSAAGPAPWNPERMEYGFSVGARLSAGEKVLTAAEYYSGRLDWQDFNVNAAASLRSNNDPLRPALVRTAVPAPISYAGMPAARFWQFEDARVEFGAVDAEPEDLARLLLIEFAITYGNDWFVIPIELEVGTLCRTHSLVVTNTFGERFVIPSSAEAGQPFASWRMFQLAAMRQPGAAATVPDPGLFVLPPALISTVESRPIEEVLFLRDEMANMAWGVEQIVESAIERPMNRSTQQRYPEPPQPDQADAALTYRLMSDVPDHWVPLLPVQSAQGLRLRRGRTLKPDGTPRTTGAVGRILNPDDPNSGALAIFEEEVPREGLHVTRTYQLARWQDGSTHLWVGRRKRVGRGEGSSGLRFDAIGR